MIAQVAIHRDARIYGASGIAIGAGTHVHGNAIVAASILRGWEHLGSDPEGRVRIGQRCYIQANSVVASWGGSIDIGDDVTVQAGTILLGQGGLTIGELTRIGPQVVIVPANHCFSDLHRSITSQGETKLGITIGRDVWIGAGARILDGVTIGDGAVVGAGAVVTNCVDGLTIVAGVPARTIGSRGISK